MREILTAASLLSLWQMTYALPTTITPLPVACGHAFEPPGLISIDAKALRIARYIEHRTPCDVDKHANVKRLGY